MLDFDWPAILHEIALCLGEEDAQGRRTACGRRLLARDLGYPDKTVQGWMEGSTPRHPDGEHVLDRWCVLVCKARQFAPRARASLSAAKV
jgi:hypothetical protein